MTNEELLKAIKIADDFVSQAEGVGIIYFAQGYGKEKADDVNLLKKALEEAGVE
jgi:hypothetical protein